MPAARPRFFPRANAPRPTLRHRVVRAELPAPGPPAAWPDAVAQHPKDLLQSAVALQGDNLVLRYLSDVAGKLALHR